MVSRRSFLALSASTIAALAGCSTTPQDKDTSTTSPATSTDEIRTVYDIPNQLTGDITSGDGKHPYIGTEDPDYYLHYFSDFNCPFCYQWETRVLPEVYKKYVKTGKVGIFIRPVGVLGAKSRYMATAAYEFFEYATQPDVSISQETYFDWFLTTGRRSEHGDSWATEEYIQTSLEERGVNGADEILAAVNDYDSYPAEVVDNNEQLGATYDMNGTPFFIGVPSDGVIFKDGISVQGAQPMAEFDRLFRNLEK